MSEIALRYINKYLYLTSGPGKLWAEVRILKRVSVLILGEDQGHDAFNDWHKVASYAKEQLELRYPGKVDVSYMTLEDAQNNYHAAPQIGPNNKAPLVFVDEELVLEGRKLSMPEIADAIEKKLH